MGAHEITITGARVNNLKNVSCRIPHERVTVITGLSGSGKSSLAFDTLYAEGQRRYIESMSAYARQFLARIEKPDVDNIQHILPAIALEQKNHVKNARSTVGTATEIDDYLRILFAAVGRTRCDVCGGEVSRSNPQQIEKVLQEEYPEGSKVLLLAPVALKHFSLADLLRQGFFRILHEGQVVEAQTLKDTLSSHDHVRVVIDRLIVKPQRTVSRLLESIRSALTLGQGHLEIYRLDVPGLDEPDEAARTRRFQNEYACVSCQKVFPEPFPNMFSFNSPLGACETCEGYGRIIGLDMDKVIPNKALSLAQGAIHPFSTPSSQDVFDAMMALCRKRKIPTDVPYESLSDKQKAILMEESGDYPGIRGFFEWLESKKYKVHVRVMLSKYRGYYECPDCLGSRIRREALQVFVGGMNILEVARKPVSLLAGFFESLSLDERERILTERVLREISRRLRYLCEIGLPYLTLNRQFRTLSNGEAQRINLSAALGSGLTDTLYVLDEPTVGLHARDTRRLIRVLQDLRDHGNTIVMVEHDPDVILQADHVIDMGPGGGEDGGRILYEGDVPGLLATTFSTTARYLNQPPGELEKHLRESAADAAGQKEPHGDNPIEIVGASGHNLKNITVQIPKNRLVCVTGVSGSGKSTLIKQTLFAAYEHAHGRSLQLDATPCQALHGLDDFKDVLLVDQSPPGRSIRSNPVTYVKAYDDIRKLFAETRKAMLLGISAGHFSFNTPGGRCETCEGLGTLTIDMQFMADVTVVCHDCQGRRFNPNVLGVEWHDKNINDVLNLTVDEALTFFAAVPRLLKKLYPLKEIGLGYLKLGQSTATLSGGEAQRLKLASYLPNAAPGVVPEASHYLFLFDEPTTGLHMADIDLLVQAFRRLLSAGHSVIVIEHNIDFIAHADHIIDLGPEGGEKGGTIVAQGPIETIMSIPTSETGQFLSQRLQSAPASKPTRPKSGKKPTRKTVKV